MHEVPDKYLEDLMKVAKKIAEDQKLENYNIIQVRSRPFRPLLPSKRS